MAVFLEGAFILIYLTVSAHLCQEMMCLMGQEPDSNAAHRYRWVIPVEDPCKCTEIRPGGINNRAPGRHFKVIYFDNILISKSQKEIHKWLNCSDASQDNKVHTELIGSIPASQSAILSTHATSNAPVTSFSCKGRVDNVHYADPYNCTMFYHCDNDVARHKTCGLGLHFDELKEVCVWPLETTCNV